MRSFGAVLGHADGHRRSQASEARRLIKTPDWISERPPREAIFLFLLGDHQKTRNDRATWGTGQYLAWASRCRSLRPGNSLASIWIAATFGACVIFSGCCRIVTGFKRATR